MILWLKDFYFLCLKPFGEGFHGEAILDGGVSDTCATQRCQVSTAAQCLPDVAGEGSDIGTF